MQEKTTNRRSFLAVPAATVAGVTTLGGAVLWGRAVLGRQMLANQLVSNISPILVDREHGELTSVPAAAAEQMKLWFTGACLNSVEFIDTICSESFVSRLSQYDSQPSREAAVANEFLNRVLSPSSAFQQIELIGQESGTVLDRNWKKCCLSVAEQWELKLDGSHQSITDGLQQRLDRLISTELDEVVSQSEGIADRPSAWSSAKRIGVSAMIAVPLMLLPTPANPLAVPAFVLSSVYHLASYVIGRLFQDVAAAKVAISDRLALLGNRVAAEFQSELKIRIADLHTWQNEALRKTAKEYADAQIHII